MTIYLR